jgi:sterol desaturase/sphingolipid hydroxylase (fatty acid hydroxylase superfamily)
MLAYDAYFFFVHLASHRCKPLFRFVHGMHHETPALLGVATTGWFTPQEGVLFVGLPLGALAAAAWAWAPLGRSWWYLFVPVRFCLGFGVALCLLWMWMYVWPRAALRRPAHTTPH